MRLNLGCGHTRRTGDGWVNVDQWPGCKPDVVMDLEDAGGLTELWPGECFVEEVTAHHVLEHVRNFTGLMQWLYRVMKSGALLDVVVPHPLSDAFIGDPTHVRPITVDTFNLLSKAKCAEWKAAGISNTPLADILGVDFEVLSYEARVSPLWSGKPVDAIRHAAAHQWNVIDELHFVIRRV